MDDVSIGVVARLWRWLRDFAAMPGRIARLAEIKESDADKRLACKSCSAGRVGNFRRVIIGTRVIANTRYDTIRTIGVCDSCGQEWQVSDNADHLLSIMTRESH